MSTDENTETAPGSPEVMLSGHPSAAEAAAVVVALAAVGASSGAPRGSSGGSGSWWNSRSRAARPPLTPGPGAWRASQMPR